MAAGRRPTSSAAPTDSPAERRPGGDRRGASRPPGRRVTIWAFSLVRAGHMAVMSGTTTQPRAAQPEPVPDGQRSAASTATPAPSAPDHAPSTAELIRRATEQLSTLVRDELALARAEMAQKLAHAGKGAGLFGGAGVVALYGVFGLLAAAVLGLAQVIPAWAAAL